MASKKSTSKLEAELDKLRNFNKWDELRAKANDLSSKDSKYDILSAFLIAECIIEKYLYFNPIGYENSLNSSQQNDLSNAKTYLLNIINKNDEKYSNDAYILLAKLFYTQKQYKKALDHLNLVTNLIENKKSFTRTTLTLRQKQLLGECYALRGLCLEQQSENLSLMKQSYDLSMEITFEYIKILNEIMQTNLSSKSKKSIAYKDDNSLLNDLLSPLLELSLEKSPFLNIKHSTNKFDGIDKFRELLLSNNSFQLLTNIRLNLLKKYSQSLLCYVNKQNYVELSFKNKKDQKLFKPDSYDEETLLCLSLAQHLSSKEVMILRQPKYKQARDLTYSHALNSFDMLTIYLCFNKSYSLISEKVENTMKFSFEKFHIWYQYGLSLMSSKKYQKAYSVLTECNRINSTHLNCLLLLAQLALQHLFLLDEAVKWSDLAIEISHKNSLKAFILKGCSLVTKAQLQKQHNLKFKLYEDALDLFKKAHSLDEYDYLPLYHLAHTYSMLRQIDQALVNVNKALKFKPDNKDCLHLLCLLLTSNKNYEEAYAVISKACYQYEDYELIKTKAKLEELLFDSNKALKTLVSMIFIYKKNLQSLDNTSHIAKNSTNSSSNIETVTLSSFNNDNGSSFINLEKTFRLNEVIGKTINMLVQTDDSSSFTKESTYLNRRLLENLIVLINILIEIGEFFIRNNRLLDAELCSQEIAQLYSMSHLNLYFKARICQTKKDFKQARVLYTNALSINPNQLETLEQLSRVLYEMKIFDLAESKIREAIALNSSLPQLWSLLGDILIEKNDSNASMKCYETSIKLEATNPIVQFSSLTKIL